MNNAPSSHEVIIQKLEYADLPGLKHLYEDGFQNATSDIKKMEDIFKQIQENSLYNILVAKIDNKIVGSVMGIACHELFGQCQPFMVIENVVVLNECRRMGIAKKLMTQIEEIAQHLGCTTILFVSSEHRTGAHALYESLGYGIDKVNGYRKRLPAV